MPTNKEYNYSIKKQATTTRASRRTNVTTMLLMHFIPKNIFRGKPEFLKLNALGRKYMLITSDV